jgi:hypothetical protein
VLGIFKIGSCEVFARSGFNFKEVDFRTMKPVTHTTCAHTHLERVTCLHTTGWAPKFYLESSFALFRSKCELWLNRQHRSPSLSPLPLPWGQMESVALCGHVPLPALWVDFGGSGCDLTLLPTSCPAWWAQKTAHTGQVASFQRA